MVTFRIIEATQLHGSNNAEQFQDSVYRRYRFVSGDSNNCATSATKSDNSLDAGCNSDDILSTKPLYVYFLSFCTDDN